MTLITADLNAFSNALQQSAVICTSDGYWTTTSETIQKTQAMIGVDKHRVIKIARIFANALDDLEKLSRGSGKTKDELLKYVDVAETIQTALEKTGSKRAGRWSQKLKSRVVALQTRHSLTDQVFAKQELVDRVKELANEWKLGSHIRGREDLDSSDLTRLRKIERNGAFVEQLTLDADLRSRFFDWVLRDRIDPEPFVLFPSTCARLTKARLSHRIGFYGGGHLKVKDNSAQGKDLTLPIGGREVSILDDRLVVQLGHGYSQTVGQIIETFINRQWEIGNVEYFKDGIRNWNPKRLGPYVQATGRCQQIDLKKESWWEQFPVVKELSTQEASSRFDLPLDGVQWAVAVRAAREYESDAPVSIHGWLQVAIPMNGGYRLFDFGKYTEEFPRAWNEYIDVVTNTVPAVITYPDEAAFSMDRQHTWHAVAMSPDEGKALMNSVNSDMMEVNDGNLPFQFLADNCARWAWKKANETVGDEAMPPETTQMKFVDLKPSGIMGKFFAVLRYLPKRLQWIILTAFVCLLGAWKKMKVFHKDGTVRRVSLLSQLPWNKRARFHSPSQVFRFKS